MNIKKTAVVDPAAAFAIRNGCWLADRATTQPKATKAVVTI